MQPQHIVLTFTGRRFSAVEHEALESAAVKCLRLGLKVDERAFIDHPILTGLITRKKNGTLGGISGSIFFVQMDAENGVARTIEILVPKRSELKGPTVGDIGILFDPKLGMSEEVEVTDRAQVHRMN